jgi:hypothetical protein
MLASPICMSGGLSVDIGPVMVPGWYLAARGRSHCGRHFWFFWYDLLFIAQPLQCLRNWRNSALILSPLLETNLLINCFLEKQLYFLRILFRISQPDIEWMNFCSYCKRELLYSSPIFKGVFYCRVSSLMTDQTDRLASTVINLVLPDKVL